MICSNFIFIILKVGVIDKIYWTFKYLNNLIKKYSHIYVKFIFYKIYDFLLTSIWAVFNSSLDTWPASIYFLLLSSMFENITINFILLIVTKLLFIPWFMPFICFIYLDNELLNHIYYSPYLYDSF